MGGGSYSDKDWKAFSTSRGYHRPGVTAAHIYRSSSLDPMLDPKKFEIRESVDSEDNPNSTPIIVGLDVTGSMAPVLAEVAKNGLKTICSEIYERKPVTDPHICVLGIGDVVCDRSPFQATQFEADIRIFEQLEKLYLEQGGGGNNYESYILAWYFAKYRTKTDSFSKRGVRGHIFTIGDEEVTPMIRAEDFREHLGESQMRSMTATELFDLVYPEWNVYHIILKQGSHASRRYDSVFKSWCDVIDRQRVIPLDDHNKIGEVVVSTLEIAAGKPLETVAASWDGSTAITVKDSLGAITENAAAKSIDTYL